MNDAQRLECLSALERAVAMLEQLDRPQLRLKKDTDRDVVSVGGGRGKIRVDCSICSLWR